MLKVFMVVWACAAPQYERCEQLMSTEIVREADPYYWCLLNRPFAAMLWQKRLNDGWLTFTQCHRTRNQGGQ